MSASEDRLEYKRKKTTMQRRMRDYAILNCDVDPRAVPTSTVHSDQAHALDRSVVIASVVLMVAFLGLSGGSVGDIDLYQLNVAYLKDLSFRIQANALLDARQIEVL